MSFDDLLIDLTEKYQDKGYCPLWLELLWKLWVFWNEYLPWRYKRTICFFKGCHTTYYQDWNMPDEAEYRSCDRCEAIKSNYEPSTEYDFYEGRLFHRR